MILHSPKNNLLRWLCRVYPIRKGRYRLMLLLEKFLDRDETIVENLYGKYQFSVNLKNRSLESSFYYFIPELYEHETQKYIRTTVRDGMVVMDIGAHLGLISIVLADCVGPLGKVYSFEPEVKNFERLKLNAQLNSLKQVVVVPAALSDVTGAGYLSLCQMNSGHRLIAKNSPKVKTQKVDMVRLDDFVEQNKIEKIDFLKIDAEGSEIQVLNGAMKTLTSSAAPSKIICEIHSSRKQTEIGRDRVRKLFYSLGYKSYILDTQLSKKKYLAELKPEEPVLGLQNVLFEK